ncbi:MAG: hypothetical protein QM651_07830 [Rhodoblastus sp.]
MKKRRIRRPVEQGDIDGLCSIYATLNACKFMFRQSEKQDEKLLETLCRGVADVFPRIVWEGAGVPTLYRLFRIADEWVQKKHGARLLWGAPLMRTKFDTADAYLERLRDGLETFAPGEAVWIVGLGDPWQHWTVIERITGRRAYFFDSWGMKHYRFDSFTLDSDAAGEGKGKKIMIDTHQSFLLRVGDL